MAHDSGLVRGRRQLKRDWFFANLDVGVKDKITDFSVRDDTVALDNAIFKAVGADGLLAASAFHIGAAAHDANDRIIYNSDTGALIYDSNGSAAGGAIQFATLTPHLALTNADFQII